MYLVLISLHLDIYHASTSISVSLQPPMLRSTSHRYPYLDLYRYSTGPQAGWAHSQGYSWCTQGVLKGYSRGTQGVLVLNGYDAIYRCGVRCYIWHRLGAVLDAPRDDLPGHRRRRRESPVPARARTHTRARARTHTRAHTHILHLHIYRYPRLYICIYVSTVALPFARSLRHSTARPRLRH